jgi:methyl-accepting chemotaxis protein
LEKLKPIITQPASILSKFKRYRVRSLRGRFVIAAVSLLLVLLPAVYHTKNMVRGATDTTSRVNSELDNFQSEINELRRSLQSTESSIYHYTLMLDAQTREEINLDINKAENHTRQLLDLPITKQHPGLHRRVEQLNENTQRLGKETQYLLNIVDKVATRYPATPILLNQLEPTSAEFMAALDLAMDEAKDMQHEPQQKNILALFRQIRYVWSQQVNAVQVFVANRSGILGKPELNMAKNASDRQIYADQVMQLIKSLQRYEEVGLMGFQQKESLSRMVSIAKKYDKEFRSAAEIYNSDHWRADVPILNKKIIPVLREIWDSLYSLEDDLEALSRSNLYRSLKVSGSLANIILLLMGFVALALLFGFLIIEFVIRRPIVEVTKALDAEGRGEFYLPSLSAYTTVETDVMVQAFNNMREQVRSRQSRNLSWTMPVRASSQ